MLRIATWNVNSLRVRLETLVPWLTQDGLTSSVCKRRKSLTTSFPYRPLADLGYQAVFTGQKTYNGVALLSRLPITDVVLALPGALWRTKSALSLRPSPGYGSSMSMSQMGRRWDHQNFL